MQTLRFVLHDRGDSSVGIFPYTECIQVSADPPREFSEDEITELCAALQTALCPDGRCIPEPEWMREIEAENQKWDELYSKPD